MQLCDTQTEAAMLEGILQCARLTMMQELIGHRQANRTGLVEAVEREIDLIEKVIRRCRSAK